MFARRLDKNGSYFPDYTFDWNEFNAYKAGGGSIKDFDNKKLTPLTDEVVRKHLGGQITIGIYPILEFRMAGYESFIWHTLLRNFIHDAGR